MSAAYLFCIHCSYEITCIFAELFMKLTDTHIHLYAEEYDSDRMALLDDAKNKGVSRFLIPNIDAGSVEPMFDLHAQFPDACFPMMGLHPCYVTAEFDQQLEALRKILTERKKSVFGIGEIGLDFYWDLTFKKQQELAFREQVKWALEFDLPIAIHSRNSTAEIIAILHELNNPALKGVFHCFSGDINQADQIINMGFMLGIGGVVTFKNSGLDKIVEQLPLESLLLETDGPYLAPTPFRGKRNEPAYLQLIAAKVAEIKKIAVDELAEVTSENARRLFKLPN